MAKVDEAKAQEATEFLDQVAGQGMDTMEGDVGTTSYLSMVQPRGGLGISQPELIGQFQNTGTNATYGTMVEVIPVGFKVIWNERDSLGQTVGRYEPNSIEVRTEPVPKGKKGFPKKINAESGNEVVETFMYAVVFKDDPDAGFAVFIPTKSSLKVCRKWNTMLKASRLPSGAPAPIFGYTWIMATERVDEGKPTDHVRLLSVSRGELISKDLFIAAVEPARQIEMSARLAIGAPDEDNSAESDQY